MAIEKINYNYVSNLWISVFPQEVIIQGDDTFQYLNFIGKLAEDNLNNVLESNAGNNIYNLVGESLINFGTVLGYPPLLGFKAKVRISIDKIADTLVGESFNITYNDVIYPARCYAQSESSGLLLLDIETVEPTSFVFLNSLSFEYVGNLSVENIQPIALLYAGRAKESEISYREFIQEAALAPNVFKISRQYENIFNEPSPEISTLTEGKYNLFYTEQNIGIDKLLFIYLQLFSVVPTQSTLTDNFFNQEITLSSGVVFNFGYNVYGEVELQLLVYLKNNAPIEERARITEILKAYSYTPTANVPIYSSDIVDELKTLGINSIANITFLYNGLTNLQLSYQDKNKFKINDIDPVIFQQQGT